MYLRGPKDKLTGLSFTRRLFLPRDRQPRHALLWFGADALILSLVFFSLLQLMVTGFSVLVPIWLYPVLGLVSLFSAFWFRLHLKKRWRIAGSFVLFLLIALLLFLYQYPFLTGAGQFYLLARQTLEATYHESETVTRLTGGIYENGIFLVFAGGLLCLFQAWALLKKESFTLLMLSILPLLGGTVLCGGAGNTPALFGLLFGLLGCYAMTRTIRHRRLWGEDHEALQESNRLRHQRIQKKNLVLVTVTAVVLTVPGFYLIRPFLGARLRPAERVAFRLQSRFLSSVLEILPEISADQLNLEVETVGGGVSDGSLGETDGYNLQGVEDLRLTVSEKPEETIFLKGFVGSRYTGSAWEGGYETTFDAAAMNWKTEGDSRLYVQNMPFLRTAYVTEFVKKKDTEPAKLIRELTKEPALLTVERLNANSHYTYVPYGAFLNDYYVVESGDGSIEGQELSDDSFYFYFRDNYEEILKNWSDIGESKHALDQLETAYDYFCQANYLEVAGGLETLQERVDAVVKEERLTPRFDMNRIIAWVRAYLSENYTFEMDQPALEEGQDFLQVFLFERRSGYSIHFATAAVQLLRMFGVPARYVVGYEAPAAIFSVQSDGSYTATLQDDNAQAWAEVYASGIGWVPVDATPGMIGTLEEVGAGGERIRTYEYDREELRETAETETEAEQEKLTPRVLADRLTAWVNAKLRTNFTVEEMIRLFAAFTLLLAAVVLSILTGRRICRSFGLDPFRKRSAFERLALMFMAYYRVFERDGLPEEADSASEAFLEYVDGYLKRRKTAGDPEALRQARDDLYNACYGDVPVTEEMLGRMRRLARQLLVCRIRHPRLRSRRK